MLLEGTIAMSNRNWMEGCKPTRYPGIYRTTSGYRVRVRAVDPRTGTQKEANQSFDGITVEQAVLKQADLRHAIRTGGSVTERARVKYAHFAQSLFERKLALGELRSAKTRERWADTQDLHLIPYFGDWYVDAIRKPDIDEWKVVQGRKIEREEYSPNTVNGWLAILLTTLRAAVDGLELERDPTRKVSLFDTSEWATYTEEEPNALVVDEVPRFMAKARELFPQHYAMLALGLVTGRRPSELRPLRRKGGESDVLWDDGVLLVRRSETMGQVRETTKTGRRLRIPLPLDLVEVLREHVEALPKGPMHDSDLLFPSETGGFRAGSCLDKPIRKIAEAAEIKKALTPRFMRRTFQDLGRQARVHDFVVRAISGHATVAMQERYSSVAGDEVRAGLAKVISLAGFTRAPGRSASGSTEVVTQVVTPTPIQQAAEKRKAANP
jgi:integrase